MKRRLDSLIAPRYVFIMAAVAGIALPVPAVAANVTLATQPLTTTASSNKVKPNIMFVLDNSGSMASNFLPDWATSGNPAQGFHNADFNGIWYDPAVTYLPPAYFTSAGVLDTTTYPTQDGTTTARGASTATKPNWRAVKDDAYTPTSATTNLEGSADFYTTIPGEYCTAADLKTCVAASAPSVTYPYPAPLRFCTTTTIANSASPAAGTCQRNYLTNTFNRARYPMARTSVITVGTSTTSASSVSSITVGGAQILSGPAPATPSTSTTVVLQAIADSINACSATQTGTCTVGGFSAIVSSTTTVTVYANATGAFATPVISGVVGSKTFTAAAFSGGNSVPGSIRYIDIIPSINSYPYPGTTSKAPTRTDCAGATCTYNEEMTNYANWWTYYRTRIQAMKTAVSRAFQVLDNRFRVGFATIADDGVTNSAKFLGNDTFELAYKKKWYDTVFAQGTPSFTPLRGALSKIGRYYADRYPGQVDPVQYSCQQNFTILSTDGYWNTDWETSTYGPYGLSGAVVGNQDPGPSTVTPRPMMEGTTAEANTLADVAKYYYETDLRTSALGNCAGATSPDFPAGNPDVCANNVYSSPTDPMLQQHMTTFTMGLGADGFLTYTPDYDTATSGDFYNLKKGLGSPTVNWPDPITNTSEARIDDLWHAAVNGRGKYFSAKNPDQMVAGLTSALSAITAKLGAGAAAATSTLNPTSTNNFAYVASYTTMKWIGNLEARTININTGAVSTTATWCVESVGSCSGTLAGRVGANSDTRTIYTANNAGTALVPFDAAYATANPVNFSAAHINGLSQWGSIDQSKAVGVNLINYLRGQTGYENNGSNPIPLYRAREGVTLGDALESQPAFIAAPTFTYSYPGYQDFVTAQATRSGTVYLGTNDGMLHAFDASNGQERWAYVPTPVIPNMWRLADYGYANMHTNYVNGSVFIGDICMGTCSAASDWHTILVGGLNGGGRGYYALDITAPNSPSLLWEFNADKAAPHGDADLGYTFGRPVVARMQNGTWVVLVTSGYDNGTLSGDSATLNSPAGSGHGVLYVLDAAAGTIINKISTGSTVGTSTTPSGLGQIAVLNNAAGGNEAGYVYGGDLLGNVWRFDINTTPTPAPLQLATLKDANGVGQPITTAPILGSVSGKLAVFVGTGKFLELSDLSNKQVQSLYAIKDDGTAVGNPRLHTGATDKMVQQTINASISPRTGSVYAVDFSTDRGWFVDFPDVASGSERQNINSRLVLGTLLVPTTVPSATACSPGGYSWLNCFNFENGWPQCDTSNAVSVKYDAVIVGLNVIYIHGDPLVEVVTSNDPTPAAETRVKWPNRLANFKGTKSMWRELLQ